MTALFLGHLRQLQGGGPRVVVSTAAFHARVRGSVPGLGGLKETKMFLPHPRVKVSIAGSLRDREVACSASDRQGSNFESCVWRTVSSQSSHHPQEVLLAQFSLYVHKGGLKPDSFHFIYVSFKYDTWQLLRFQHWQPRPGSSRHVIGALKPGLRARWIGRGSHHTQATMTGRRCTNCCIHNRGGGRTIHWLNLVLLRIIMTTSLIEYKLYCDIALSIILHAGR